MPGEVYTSPDTFVEEHERIFARAWQCVGRSSSIGAPGDFIVRAVAGELSDRSPKMNSSAATTYDACMMP